MVLSLDAFNVTCKNYLLRNIDVKKMFELIDKYEVTHFGGAPIVLNMIS
jgi:acyl-coenzyme A synthetase/AMP-(fatty) acid ligase